MRLVAGVTGAAAVAAASAGSTWWLAAPPVRRLACLRSPTGCRPPSVDGALLAVCAVALAGCLAWFLVVLLVSTAASVAAEVTPGRAGAVRLTRVAERTCPVLVRRGVATVVGLAMGAGAASAHAAPPGAGDRPAPAPRTAAAVAARLDGLALPDRVTGAGVGAVARAVVLRRVRAPEHPSRLPVVVVRPGDSLWSIASTLLGPGASAADVAGGWHRIASRNATRLGPDPDLILPGTRLRVPVLAPPSPSDERHRP